MKFSFRPLVLTAMAFGLAASAVAQEAPPPPAPVPEASQPVPPVETPPAVDTAPVTEPASDLWRQIRAAWRATFWQLPASAPRIWAM